MASEFHHVLVVPDKGERQLAEAGQSYVKIEIRSENFYKRMNTLDPREAMAVLFLLSPEELHPFLQVTRRSLLHHPHGHFILVGKRQGG